MKDKQLRNLDLILGSHWRGLKGFEAREFAFVFFKDTFIEAGDSETRKGLALKKQQESPGWAV